MGISLSILLIAVGAILAWAVNAEAAGIDLQVAGIILVVVGAIGLVASGLRYISTTGGLFDSCSTRVLIVRPSFRA